MWRCGCGVARGRRVSRVVGGNGCCRVVGSGCDFFVMFFDSTLNLDLDFAIKHEIILRSD